MEARGYHPTIGRPGPGESHVDAVAVEYPDAETARPALAEDGAACAEQARTAPPAPATG